VKDIAPEGQVDATRWQAVHDELAPAAAGARTPEELRPILVRMLQSLGHSHYTVIPGRVTELVDATRVLEGALHGIGDAGLDVRIVGDLPVVTRLAPGGAADLAGVEAGDGIRAIDGEPTATDIASIRADIEDPWLAGALGRAVVLGRLARPATSAVAVSLDRPDAGPFEVEIVLGATRAASWPRAWATSPSTTSSCPCRSGSPSPCARSRRPAPTRSSSICAATPGDSS
jgi:hypothetical protein